MFLLNEVDVSLQSFLLHLGGDPYVLLCNSNRAVLQKLLDQDYVVIIVKIDLSSKELPE